jgi:hypothetical protein
MRVPNLFWNFFLAFFLCALAPLREVRYCGADSSADLGVTSGRAPALLGGGAGASRAMLSGLVSRAAFAGRFREYEDVQVL